jgi:hypothetical protein
LMSMPEGAPPPWAQTTHTLARRSSLFSQSIHPRTHNTDSASAVKRQINNLNNLCRASSRLWAAATAALPFSPLASLSRLFFIWRSDLTFDNAKMRKRLGFFESVSRRPQGLGFLGPPPPPVFCMGAAGAHPRRRPEKYGFNANLNPRRHGRPREVHGVVCYLVCPGGRSGAAANARQCVIWSLECTALSWLSEPLPN